jgi:glycosyltransferase involved in cell wall biosynthesis
MRFAFISTMHDWPWGGSEELWSQTAIRLKQSGHQVYASVGFRSHLPSQILGLIEQGIQVKMHASNSVPLPRRIWNRASQFDQRCHAALRRFRPDLVVISQGFNAGGFGWARTCREAGIPYVIIVHCNCELWWFREQDIGDAVASYNTASRVFCVSRANLDLLRLQLGEPLLNAELLWNPYNVSSERTPAWPDESGGWRLACVARMDPAAKGQDLLLKTLARPEWRDRPVELNCYGTGPHEFSMRRMSEILQLNNVHFRGHVTDIRAVWEQNHLLVLPSRFEGMPLALIESMWCGRPAVVTDVGGNAELCIDGETGFVAPAATVSSFSGALQSAWDRRKDWPHLGKAARALAESKIPKDPVALFGETLKTLAVAAKSSAA